MLATEEYITDQIRNLKDFSKWGNRPEVFFLPKIVRADEKILALTVALFDERKWLFTVTDRRIIFIHKKFFDAVSDVIQFDQVDSIRLKKGLLFCQLTISTSEGKDMLFKSVMKKDAEKITCIMETECPGLQLC